MPNEAQHKIQIIHNYSLVQVFKAGIEGKDYKDWLITTSFYTSMHAVEWYLCRKKGWHSKNHLKRRDNIDLIRELDPIGADYNELYELSISARYECVLPTLRPERIMDAVDINDSIISHIKSIYSDFPDLSRLRASSSSSSSVGST